MRRSDRDHVFLLSLVMAAALSSIPSRASAVFKLDLPLSKYCEQSKAVFIGKVEAVGGETRVVDVDVSEVLRGQSAGRRLRIQIVSPVEVLKQISPGQPVVVFVSHAIGGMAAIHVADTWLLAKGVPNSEMLAWRVVQLREDLRQTFPGRTAALVRVMEDIKAGRNMILDEFKRKIFPEGVRKRAKLDVQKPAWMLAADFNGDKKPDLLIGTASRTRLFVSNGDQYTDATGQWGAWGAAGKYRAAGDIDGDGKTDLLLDDTLWINQGNKFAPARSRLELPSGKPLAAALVDVTGDKRPDAVLLAADGELRVFENPGAPDKPWPLRATKTLWKEGPPPSSATFGDWGDTGKLHVMAIRETGIVRYALDDDGGPSADLLRLTGADLRKDAKYRNGLKDLLVVPLRPEGGPRTHLFAVCDTGTFLLVNRGFGTFFFDDKAGFTLTGGANPAPMKLSPATPAAAADLHGHGADDLLLLGEDGTLYEADNGAK